MSSNNPAPPGVMRAVKAKLETEVFSAPSEAVRMLGCVLVCDDWALNLVGAIYKMNDLTRHGIPLVESIKLPCGERNGRQSLPRNPVIYLCRCTRQNIDYILSDWRKATEDRPKDWEVRPYSEAHVFFVSKAEKSLTDLLLPAKLLAQHLKSFKDLRMDFVPVEPHLFSLEVEKDLRQFYSKQLSPAEMDHAVTNVATRILDVVQTMGDTVTVRHQKGGKCTVAYQVAKKLTQLQLERFGSNKGSTTLLIVDRSLDCVAPLLHELTYQAYLLDLLPKNSTVEVTEDPNPTRARVASEGKNYTLDESDELWCRVRHQHIADSGPLISKEFSEVVSSSKALNVRSNYSSGVSTEDMAAAVKDMPLIQAKLRTYQVHINLHDCLMKTLKEGGLDTICDIEQNLATGETADGMKADKEELKKQFEAYLESSVNASHANRVRLMLLYLVSQGAVSKDRQAKWIGQLGAGRGNPMWLTGTGAGGVAQIINNLSSLDVVTEKKKWYQSKSKKKKKARVDPESYDWSRFVPAIKSIAESLVGGELSEAECPHTVSEDHVTGAASSSAVGRSARKSDGLAHRPWGSSLRASSDAKTPAAGTAAVTYPNALPWSLSKSKGRFYIFMVGGASYNETRSIAEVIAEKDVEIVFGATSIINSDRFIRGLADL